MSREYTPFTQVDRDALLVLSLNRPARNIHGDLGPRCPTCSGLGSFLRLGGGEQGVTRAAARCGCDGTGIDFAAMERASHQSMWERIRELERLCSLPETPSFKLPTIKMSRQYWMECIAWATADGTAVATTAAETILFPNVTIPANYMQDGRGLRIRASGKYSTLGSGTVSHVYSLRWGGVAGTLLTKTGTVTLLISMTNAYFDLDIMIQTRSNGSAGTLLADGIARAFGGTAPTIGSATGAPAIAPMTNGGQTVPAAATCDLTADTALALTVTHGASSGSNTITGQHYTLESLN
jgi:hypothetical protein